MKIPGLGLAVLALVQLVLSTNLPCPPAAIYTEDIPAGQCVSSEICLGKDGTMTSVKGAQSGCEAILIALRCSGLNKTVTYDMLDAVPDVKCDQAVIGFNPNGLIQSICCDLPAKGVDNGSGDEIITPPPGKEDCKPRPKGNRRCDDDPDAECTEEDDWDCSTDEKGEEEEGEKGEGDNGDEEDEKDAQCYCTDSTGCPIIDLAIQKVGGTDFTIFCNRSIPGTVHEESSASSARECSLACAASATCWGLSWKDGKCQIFDESSCGRATTLDLTEGSVAFIKDNATEITGNKEATDDLKEPEVPEVKEPEVPEVPEIKEPEVPEVVLSNPIAIVGSVDGSPVNADDEFYSLEIPFPITIYEEASTQVYVGVNGLLSLGSGTTTFRNGELPATNIPSYSALGLWGDLYIYKDTPQGVYYEVSGEVGSRKIAFEWYCSHYQQPTQYYHFTMTFFEGKPGVATYKYYDVLDKGKQSTVGIQGNGEKLQFSVNEEVIVPGLELTFDTHKTLAFTQTTFSV